MFKRYGFLMDGEAGGDGGAGGAGGDGGQPWYQGLDSDTVGFLQTKGWDKLDPTGAIAESVKSYREAEKFIGAPPDQLLRVPKADADEAAWNAYYERLGRPKDASGYDLSAVKMPDGSDLDESFQEFMKQQAFKYHLPKESVAGITEGLAKFLGDAESSDSVEMQAKLASEKTELAKNWGANMEANKFIASQAAKALGVDKEAVAALENVVGYSKVMNMFLAIGQKIGEDKFITGDRPAGDGVMTRDQAVARVSELKNDKEWVKKYLAGDSAAKREMTGLNTLIAGAG